MIRTAQKAPKKRVDQVRGLVDQVTPQKRGPKPSGNAKVLLTLRLDPDVVARFRASGAGWQTRMAEALKQAVV
jgi:uncharacterized protein (DUF4415 family)